MRSMEVALVIAAILVPAGLDVWATWLVLRDDLSERHRKIAQLVFVWLVPVIRAVVVLAVHRRAEPASRRYREPPDPGEDFALSGRPAKATREAIDADDQ